MEKNIALPSFYLHQLVDVVASYGVDTPRWLNGLGLEQPTASDKAINLPWPLFRQLVLQAQEMTKEPSFGLLVGQRLLVNTHGVLGYAAMNSTSIRQGAELVERFMPLRTDLLSASIVEANQQFQLRLTENFDLQDIRRPTIEAITLALKNIMDFIAPGYASECGLSFPFAQDSSAELLQTLCHCPVRYDQSWAGLFIPLSLVDQQQTLANAGSFRDAVSICQQELRALPDQATLANRVRKLMLSQHQRFPSLELTARYFHMTPRTLHRRLLNEGTSYKKLIEEVRHQLALKYLASGRMTIQEVAYALNYTEVANFRRAFKRWQGVPPSEYIKSLAQQA